MTERPILMSSPMIRAILEGRKTVTRRVVKPWPPTECKVVVVNGLARFTNSSFAAGYHGDGVTYDREILCPHGQPGDRLWVRESFATDIPGCLDGLTYRADHQDPAGDEPANPIRWRPSIHMPRWASRITLEITGVKVERLWQMTVAKMEAEGIPEIPDTDDAPAVHPLTPFIRLWDSINAKRGYPFDSNPWVWVINFKRIESES